MLGAFDNYNLGYVDRGVRDRRRSSRSSVNPGGGIVRPSIVVDGRASRPGRRSASGKRLAVTIEPFEPLAPEVEEAIEAEVADIGRFEGLDATMRPVRPAATIPRPMNDADHKLSTDQAEREASGAHAYGRYLEEFEEGAVYKHWPAKTVTESDDHLFCLITMNHHPLHLNDVYAAESQQGQNVVVGPLVYSLALGMSVSDVSGKAIANLATEELSHPNPVFHGDTLYCESEVLEVRPSKSKPDRGIVKVHTRVYKQDNTLVAEFKRTVLIPKRPNGEPPKAEGDVE